MVTESGAHVVVNLEPVGHVNVEAFFLELEGTGITGQGSQASSPPALWGVRSLTGFPKVWGSQRPKKERRVWGPHSPPPAQSPDPGGPAHDGVPAVGCSARAAADDLVNAFLVDGGVAFLKEGAQAQDREGEAPREAESELALLAKDSPLHKASLLAGRPHPHPTQASAQLYFFLLLPTLPEGAWKGQARDGPI